MKRCIRCGEPKETTEFNKAKSSPDGLHAYCRSCQSVVNREWRTKNADYNRRRKSDWAKANRESTRRTINSWRDRNREAVRIMNDNYRARQMNAEGSHTEEEWLELCERYGNKCLKCGDSENLTRDHVIPLSRGGSNYISNIQPLCRRCNSEKHAKSVDYR